MLDFFSFGKNSCRHIGHVLFAFSHVTMQLEPTVCLGLQGSRICLSAVSSVPYSSWQIMHSWGPSAGTVFEGSKSWVRNWVLFMVEWVESWGEEEMKGSRVFNL